MIPITFQIDLISKNIKKLGMIISKILECLYLIIFRSKKANFTGLTLRDEHPKSYLPCYASGINHRLGVSDSSFNLARKVKEQIKKRIPKTLLLSKNN